ncbi:ribonuclease H-like domain-containing protein [Aspergillus desertorum]
MSSGGGPPQRGGRGRGNNRGRGPSEGRGRGGFRRDREGGRGGGRDLFQDLPHRPALGNSGRGDSRGRGDRGGRGGGGRRGRGGFDQGPPIYSPSRGAPQPSAKVTQTENSYAAALVKKERSVGYPQRPGYGTQGVPVELFANYFELKSGGKSLFRYHINIDGGGRKPSSRKAKHIISLLLEDHFPQFRHSIVTDYRSNMISHLKILDQEQLPVKYTVTYRDKKEDEPREAPETYRVTCQFTGQLDPADLLNYLTSSNAASMLHEKAEILQALNIILGHYPKSAESVASVGTNKHYAIHDDVAEKFNLGSGLEALRGYFVSVRAATARLLVNVQVKYVACYQEGPLYQVVREFQYANGRSVYTLKKFLNRVRVRISHIKRKNKRGEDIPRIKTIINVATFQDGNSLENPPKVKSVGAGPNDVSFFLDAPDQGKKSKPAGPKPSGSYITVAEFFERNYNIQVDPGMPVVNVGSIAKPSYLPVEVCEVVSGQPAKTKLSSNQTRQMLNFAVRSPAQNAQSIVTKGTETLGLLDPANPTLMDFGIQTKPSLITVPGRVLAPPDVYYKDEKSKDKQIAPVYGSWNMKSIRFSTGSNLQSWACILITAGLKQHFQNSDDLDDCLHRFAKKLKEVGVNANPPVFKSRLHISKENAESVIDAKIDEILRQHQPNLILTILPFNDTALYNCIKKACDIRHGVRNVNVLAEQFCKRNEQYFANVGLKFNLKLGGVNQVVRPNQLGIIGEGKTMLVGIDVTHPSPGSAKGAPSVAAMVASVDSSLGQWPAEIRIQREARTEMVDALDSMLKEHLRRWAANHNGEYPENIIVYRDGVSEGQYDLVTEKELPLLKNACKDIYPAPDTAKNLPGFSIIIVGKRHHTRFYPTRQEDADRSNNPVNGTVVDRGVTEARNWDFFLQAHTALKGTARPAHYYTVWDEIFLRQKIIPPAKNAADMLEAMTHHMCYLFGRATKAVSICPPAYYADLVCTRARCYLSNAFEPPTPSGSVIGTDDPTAKVDSRDVLIHPNVRDTMFYI